MQPAVAHFTFDPDSESMQDLVRAVESAGSEFDARLMLQSNADDDKLTTVLQGVSGVRNAGMQDSKGIRLVTFFLDKKTKYADLITAAASINANIAAPVLTNKEAR